MKKTSVLIFTAILSLFLFLIPMISAQWGGYSYYSPEALFNNEWFYFVLIFAVFFAVIFLSINRTFKNPGISVIVAGGLSLLIALTLAKRGLLYGYFGDQLSSWILIATVVIGLGFLIKFVHNTFGFFGVLVLVLILWFGMHNSDPYIVLPYELSSIEIITNSYIFIGSYFGLILGILLVIVLAKSKIFEGESVGESVIKSIFKRR
jgi:hypothetical protein